MYRYDEFDAAFVRQRAEQFRGQVARRLSGEISEDVFKPLRLQNGVYLQLHAYMLRVAVPYGQLNSTQMRTLAQIAETYDKGYGHFTTRQNIQFNWPALADIPDILDLLAEVGMHAIQTSGNCIRNVTSDPWAGAAADELEDPRPYAELLRQWSMLHPEFAYLPRKFKIAVTAAKADRAAVRVHDIGLVLKKNDEGQTGFEVIVGGGLGRTPFVGKTIREFLGVDEMLGYLTALVRVYNLEGRRDNKYKARIKITVHEQGLETFREKVEAEYAQMEPSDIEVSSAELARIQAYFAPPAFDTSAEPYPILPMDPGFDGWRTQNVAQHRMPGYAIVNISLKPTGGIPGDANADQMRAVADLAKGYGLDDIRVTHEQNLVLPHVKLTDLPRVYQGLLDSGLATANIGQIGDMIACPGMDYCALATARSIPIAQSISEHFEDCADKLGELKIKISGCINACGHHHVGHIGILGVDKKGEELYQLTLGGSGDETASIGKIIGPGFSAEAVPGAIQTLLDTYESHKSGEERFLDTYRRLGDTPFKEALYGSA